MSRAIFEPEHEAFRETVGTFLDKEAVPFHAQWEKDGIVDREVWAKAGAQGLLALPAPRGVRRRRDDRLPIQPRGQRGDDPPRRLRLRLPALQRHDRALPRLERERRAAAAVVPRPLRRHHHRRDRDDRARCRLRPAGHPDDGGRRGRPLRAQRPEDLHLQRHPRRPRDRGRPDRPRGRAPGHQPAGGRARHGGLRTGPQPREDRPARPGHRRAVLRPRCASRRRTSSAGRARASCT